MRNQKRLLKRKNPLKQDYDSLKRTYARKVLLEKRNLRNQNNKTQNVYSTVDSPARSRNGLGDYSDRQLSKPSSLQQLEHLKESNAKIQMRVQELLASANPIDARPQMKKSAQENNAYFTYGHKQNSRNMLTKVESQDDLRIK